MRTGDVLLKLLLGRSAAPKRGVRKLGYKAPFNDERGQFGAAYRHSEGGTLGADMCLKHRAKDRSATFSKRLICRKHGGLSAAWPHRSVEHRSLRNRWHIRKDFWVVLKFSRTIAAGITVYTGDPDCQAAHDELLQFLRAKGTAFLPKSVKLSTARQGNLGEHIAYRIARHFDFHRHRARTANAHEPLSAVSLTHIDILWVFIGETPGEDLAIVQEVKTTGQSDLGLANDLISDYDKLFSTNPQMRLISRLQAFAAELEDYDPQVSPDVLDRIIALAKGGPVHCTQVSLAPTLVHDSQYDAVPKLTAVRSAIASQGWSSAGITPVSIHLDDLMNRLERLTHGDS